MPERDIIYLDCHAGRHNWQLIGGRNASCNRHCTCSVPVYECPNCGDCDYGCNPEGIAIIEQCVKSF